MYHSQEEDRLLVYGELGNYSITGIEIQFNRHKFKYVYVYYLPSGKIRRELKNPPCCLGKQEELVINLTKYVWQPDAFLCICTGCPQWS